MQSFSSRSESSGIFRKGNSRFPLQSFINSLGLKPKEIHKRISVSIGAKGESFFNFWKGLFANRKRFVYDGRLMEKVTSKISNLYIGKVVALHFFALIFVPFCTKYTENIYLIEKRIFAWIGIAIIVVFLLIIWKEVSTSRKIVVDNDELTIYNLVSVKRIHVTEIEDIVKHKFNVSRVGLEITDGYSYSEIRLKEGGSVIITPEKFENYSEIMSAINSTMEQSSVFGG